MVCRKLKNFDFKCAVFDMDGTILDSMPMWHGVSDSYLSSHGVQLASSVWDDVKRLTETETALFFKEKFGIADPVGKICGEFESIIFDEYARSLELKDGAREVLETLNGMGVPCVLATATNRKCVEACLGRLGIAGLFREVLTCLDLGTSKHEPLIFQKAAEVCGASAGESVVFEDALHCVETAKNAGFGTCAVFDSSALEKCSDGRSDWEHMEETADFVIKSWRDIL